MDRINTPEENLTSLFLGELEDSEKIEVETMLDESPDMLEELDSISELASLLSEGFDSEWKAQDIAFDNEADATSYALNELDASELAEFEARMHESSSLKQEVEQIRSFTSGFNREFENEWMAHHPVDIDNICFTDLAAGELDGFEECQAVALVNSASFTKKEADATTEMMELLSASLTDEWQSELEPKSTLSVVEKDEVAEPVSQQPKSETVVRHNFSKEARPARSRTPLFMTAAAAVTGLVAVGAVMFGSNDPSNSNLVQTSNVEETSLSEPASSGVWKYASSTSIADANKGTGIKVPTLLLVDEVADSLESIETVSNDAPSYSLGNGSIQTVGFSDQVDVMPTSFETENLGGYKFDLPPIDKGRVTYSVRNNEASHRSILMSDRREHTNGLQSVYVQGLFTFPEGTDFDVNTVFEPKKVEAIYKELVNVRTELEATIKSLDSDNVDISELKRKLTTTLEHYRELNMQFRSQ